VEAQVSHLSANRTAAFARPTLAAVEFHRT
jgi:hypothetical protein